VADRLAHIGIRTLGVDLPGFGKTPGEPPLTPQVLAEPVIELAKSLERPPIVLGMSMGGRVALEVALRAPQSVRGLVLVAPYLPWLRYRNALAMAEHMDPAWGERLPLERAWPILSRTTAVLDMLPGLEHDWFARACVRVAYYSTCPATRAAVVSASRELALDPAFGPDGLWTRLPDLEPPACFLWAGRDRLIPSGHAGEVARVLPSAAQIEVGCSGHFVNFRHFRCMEEGIALAVERVLALEAGGMDAESTERTAAPCRAGRRRRRRPSRPRTVPTS
jgi:pimeloyl-ACP methyl ester carboxylesterase